MVATTPEHYSSKEKAKEDARSALLPRETYGSNRAWDRFIAVMRILLPILAIILGGVTALWPFLNETEVSFTLSRDDVAEGDGRVRMTNLKYVGTDADNRLFTVRAKSGEQDDPSAPRIRLTDIEAEMSIDPTLPAKVNARTGIYRMREGSLSLVGGVHLETGNGYILDMAGADIDLKARTAKGQGKITGQSELGTLEANRMSIIVKERTGLFEGGVKMRITPKRPDGSTNTEE